MTNCNKCFYSWESRVLMPKACPRCKSRMDFGVNVRPMQAEASMA